LAARLLSDETIHKSNMALTLLAELVERKQFRSVWERGEGPIGGQ
jgi:hypothetical protein